MPLNPPDHGEHEAAQIPAESQPPLPFVSVVVPCRNEERFIETCLTSIIHNGYPVDRMEVLVVDGDSGDGTVSAVTQVLSRHTCVRLLRNARRLTAVALNLAIRKSRGEYVLWMSAHNTYPPGYVAECVTYAIRYGADNVGGTIITQARDDGSLAPFIVAALSHPFGVGNSRFRVGSDEVEWVDTVFGGCYRRDVFERVGLFNEALERGQDMEFNLRLKRAGLRTLLVPSIQSVYYARSRLGEFIRHNWINGVWGIRPFEFAQHPPVGLRHLVPLVFVVALILGGLTSFWFPGVRWLMGATMTAYAAVALAAGVHLAWRHRDWRFALAMPFVFLLLHVSYGAGSLRGLWQVITASFRRRGSAR